MREEVYSGILRFAHATTFWDTIHNSVSLGMRILSLFGQTLPYTVPQSAEFAIQEMRAPEERQ